MIVDSKNDLNVYTASQSLSDKSCCSDQKCQSGCCDAGESVAGTSLTSLIEELKDVDLNEWAGLLSCRITSVGKELTLPLGSFQVYALKA